MKTAILQTLVVIQLASKSQAQLAQTLTTDNQGHPIYVPSAGAPTSSVAAPQATPTLIYNCFNMPLICENVAAYAISSGNAQGDLSGPLLLYFDPDSGNKDIRRAKACGCFAHDDCVGSGISHGKRAGDKVTDIAGTFPSISPAAVDIIKAGSNPKAGASRVPLDNVPGRFFAQGVGFTCDGQSSFPSKTTWRPLAFVILLATLCTVT